MRFRDAALVASLLAAAPALGGTPVANPEGMEITPNLVPIPVAETTPPAGSVEAPVAATDAGPAAQAPVAEKPVESLFETLIADFRWGDPEMGAVPHLPVPPPHKMRAEDTQEGGDETPLDGNGGNALPLALVSLPLSADPAQAATMRSLAPSHSLRGSETLVQQPSRAWRAEVTTGGDAVIRSPAPSLPGDTNPSTADGQGADAAFRSIERQLMERAARPVAADGANPASGQSVPSGASAAANANAAAAHANAAAHASSAALASGAAATAAQSSSQFDAAAIRAALESNAAGVPAAFSTSARSAATARDATRAPVPVAVSMQGVDLRTTLHETTERGFSAMGERGGTQAEAPQPFTLATAPTANPAAASSATRADPPVLQLSTPLATPEWADGLGERVVWLTSQNLDNAHIRLNPAHLGPVEVRVSVADDRASVAFVAHHAVTRDALESAAPRLREMLQAQGFTNVNVEIGGQQSQQSANHRSAEQSRYWSSVSADDTREARSHAPARTPGPRSVLDTFA
jgi:flagellar hook-length control protein FliK